MFNEGAPSSERCIGPLHDVHVLDHLASCPTRAVFVITMAESTEIEHEVWFIDHGHHLVHVPLKMRILDRLWHRGDSPYAGIIRTNGSSLPGQCIWGICMIQGFALLHLGISKFICLDKWTGWNHSSVEFELVEGADAIV